MRYLKSKTFAGLVGAAAALAVFVTFAMSANAQDKKPIKIGFGMAQTGPLGPNGKSAMLAMDIWVEETNAKGGLLGRPVKLVHYDDQSNPSTVPGIYTKLLDVDKVDVIVGGYGDQYAGAGDADRDAAQEDVPWPVRPRRQSRIQLRPITSP